MAYASFKQQRFQPEPIAHAGPALEPGEPGLIAGLDTNLHFNLVGSGTGIGIVTRKPIHRITFSVWHTGAKGKSRNDVPWETLRSMIHSPISAHP